MSAVLLCLCLFQFSVRAGDRTPWTTSKLMGSPNPPSPYSIARIHPALGFTNPVDIAFAPGSTVAFVAEERGKVWTFDVGAPTPQKTLALDLRSVRKPFDNILAIVFHPGFTTNRQILINYNEPSGKKDGARVSRFTVTSLNPPSVDPESEKIIITWPSGGHNGCGLAFGKDGALFISTGDQADPDPPDNKAKTGQDISDLLSAVLRIHVNLGSDAPPYSVPKDNPFIQHPGARPEVYAFGFRNPFRICVDPVTDELWLGDVGWEQWEMIHRVVRGGNYGWSLTEGPNQKVRTDLPAGPGPILPAMVALPHSEAASITGGQVYRGTRLPRLHGAYVYGDWETGKFWALRNEGEKLLSNLELCDTALKPVAFCIDPKGELLVLDYGGGLYEFIPNPAPPANAAFPRKLSETGLFAKLTPLEPSVGVEAYHPSVTAWTDGARVSHHLGIPGSDFIETTAFRQTIAGAMWRFPSNTVFARTAALPRPGGAGGQPVETQILHFDGQAWNPYSFRWNETGTDADLLPAEGFAAPHGKLGEGGGGHASWSFQSRAECMRCHNSWASETLSFNWLQLAPPERTRLENLGLMVAKNPPRDTRTLPSLQNPDVSLEDRARSWLHINCAGCHRFGAGGSAAIQLNFERSPRDWRALDEPPLRGDFGITGARIIAPGDPYRSTLLYRISTEGAGHMPHIGSQTVDEEGVRWISEWIRSLPRPEPSPAGAPAPEAIEEAVRAGNHSFLLSSVNGALALANSLSVSRGTRPPPGAASHDNPMISSLFQRFLPAAERRHTLGSNPDEASILSLKGSPARGQEVFAGAGQCSRCHLHGGQGRAFGPDLTDLKRRYSRVQMLEHMVRPSSFIAPEFKSWSFSMKDGAEFSGVVMKRSADETLLRDANGMEHHLRAGDIESSTQSALSAMPEGLLAPLTAQEAADLLEFLAQ